MRRPSPRRSRQSQSILPGRKLHLTWTSNTLLGSKQINSQKQNTLLTQTTKCWQDSLSTMTNLYNEGMYEQTRMLNTVLGERNLQRARAWGLESRMEMERQWAEVQSHEMGVRLRGMELVVGDTEQRVRESEGEFRRRLAASEDHEGRLERENQELRGRVRELELEAKVRETRGKIEADQQQKVEEREGNRHRIVSLQTRLRQSNGLIAQLQNTNRQLGELVGQYTRQIQQLQAENKSMSQQLKQLRLLSRYKDRRHPIEPPFSFELYEKPQQQAIEAIPDPTPEPQQEAVVDFPITKQMISSLVLLRNGINRDVFTVFILSIKEADQRKKNGLSVFLSKWKAVEINRLEPYTTAYMQARQSLLDYLQTPAHQPSGQHPDEWSELIRRTLPLHLLQPNPLALPPSLQSQCPAVFKTHSRLLHLKQAPSRSPLNCWVLNTVDFTLNQHSLVPEHNAKTELLHLFRLLTVQYRIAYPGRGQGGVVDEDVRACLLDWTVMAVKNVIDIV